MPMIETSLNERSFVMKRNNAMRIDPAQKEFDFDPKDEQPKIIEFPNAMRIDPAQKEFDFDPKDEQPKIIEFPNQNSNRKTTNPNEPDSKAKEGRNSNFLAQKIKVIYSKAKKGYIVLESHIKSLEDELKRLKTGKGLRSLLLSYLVVTCIPTMVKFYLIITSEGSNARHVIGFIALLLFVFGSVVYIYDMIHRNRTTEESMERMESIIKDIKNE